MGFFMTYSKCVDLATNFYLDRCGNSFTVHEKQRPRKSGAAVILEKSYLALIKGLPLAAGTWDLPTKRISTMTVTT